MSQDAQPHLSLLSLSIAAANAAPIPAAASVPRSSHATVISNTIKHRRLSSTGRSRRRLSDARDAATRPFPTSLQTTSVSLAALSLSSPTVSHRQVHGAQPIQVPRAVSVGDGSGPEPAGVDDAHFSISPPSHTPLTPNGIKSGRKRGTIFTCESCSKVYRHPSCLIKHRWEHTPQWQEASKFVLSKHQQVQLLEAAAILSHLSPSSGSLPEDRSLWPSFLSGGLIPPPTLVLDSDAGLVVPTTMGTATTIPISAAGIHTSYPISSSVPVSMVLGSHVASTGPRLHNYTIGRSGIGVTQVRPGMLGVPTTPAHASSPMFVPAQQMASSREDDALNLLALRSASVTSGSWGSSTSGSVPLSSSSLSHARLRRHGHSHSLSYSHSSSALAASKEKERRRSNAYEYGSASGSGLGYEYRSGSAAYAYASNSSNARWSLLRSSVRSKSGSSGTRSQSQSASESRSDDEDDAAFGDGDIGLEDETKARSRECGPRVRAWKTEDGDGGVAEISVREDEQENVDDEKGVKKRVEQTWDGMEMEMEMEMD